MGGYRRHIIFYAAIVAVLYYLLGSWGVATPSLSDIPAIFVGGVYALIPDIDAKTSKARGLLNDVFMAAIAAFIIAYLLSGYAALLHTALTLAIFLIVLNYIRHRGFVHTVYAGLFLSMPLLLLSREIFGMAFLGYVTHLFLDGKMFR